MKKNSYPVAMSDRIDLLFKRVNKLDKRMLEVIDTIIFHKKTGRELTKIAHTELNRMEKENRYGKEL